MVIPILISGFLFVNCQVCTYCCTHLFHKIFRPFLGLAVTIHILDTSEVKKGALYKVLHVMIQADLDYTGVFDEILEEYTSSHELEQVKTANMGSLCKLTYYITLQSAEAEKERIDKLCHRNGDLGISVPRREAASCGL